LHSSAAGASATRGGITIRLGAAPSFANSNSLTPCGREADVRFIFSASGRVTRLQTNSPVALIFDTVSFHPAELNMTIGGWSHTALKKLYGARFTRPSASRVEIQPIGRGATIALNGSCGRP